MHVNPEDRALALAALPTWREAMGASPRRSKDWHETTTEDAPDGHAAVDAGGFGLATRDWRQAPAAGQAKARSRGLPAEHVSATTYVFGGERAALAFFSREKGAEVLTAREADGLGLDGAADVEVSVTPIPALAVTGARSGVEVVWHGSRGGREWDVRHRSVDLRIGRLVVELHTHESSAVGEAMAGLLARYETRLREESARYA